MNRDISPLTFPWHETPAEAQLQSVAPGVSWLRLPLPFALDHVNVWLLETKEGPVIVDAGIKSEQTLSIWRTVLSQLTQPPVGLLVTHYHPDHVGLAGWLVEQFEMPVWFSKEELDYSRGAFEISDTQFADEQDSWFKLQGMDAKSRAVMHNAGNTYCPNVYPLPPSPLLLQQGEIWPVGSTNWRVITAGGHAPEMICLYSEQLNVLIAADQVLPSITPNVSLNHYTRDNNPLERFLSSLSLFEELPEDVLVLPSHGMPFHGLHARITQLREHHDDRFDRLLAACSVPSSAADMLPVLFHRKLDFQQLMFAMGESVAHLRYLDLAGKLNSSTEQGKMRYVVA